MRAQQPYFRTSTIYYYMLLRAPLVNDKMSDQQVVSHNDGLAAKISWFFTRIW